MTPADLFELHKQEYIKLKDEQTKRIGFRDNLLYVNLLLISGILSFVFSGREPSVMQPYGLLLGGWVSLVLGWTYIVNDQKISAIGLYIRSDLAPQLAGADTVAFFGWERAHRSDERRKFRKRGQLVVDEISFAGIGLIQMIMFWGLSPGVAGWRLLLSAIEFGLLIVLAGETWQYADLARDSEPQPTETTPPGGSPTT